MMTHERKKTENGKVEKAGPFTGPHRFPMEAWISYAPFERLLHMAIIEAAEGRATLKMPFLLDFAQGAGLLHGGALVSLADTAVVMAIKSLLPPPNPLRHHCHGNKVPLSRQKGIGYRQGRSFEARGEELAGHGNSLR
jgi:acyl-CoA thioesterase